MKSLRSGLLALVAVVSVSAVFAGPNPQQYKHPHRTMRASAEAAKASAEANAANACCESDAAKACCETNANGAPHAKAKEASPKLKVVRQGKRTTVIKEEAATVESQAACCCCGSK